MIFWEGGRERHTQAFVFFVTESNAKDKRQMEVPGSLQDNNSKKGGGRAE